MLIRFDIKPPQTSSIVAKSQSLEPSAFHVIIIIKLASLTSLYRKLFPKNRPETRREKLSSPREAKQKKSSPSSKSLFSFTFRSYYYRLKPEKRGKKSESDFDNENTLYTQCRRRAMRICREKKFCSAA